MVAFLTGINSAIRQVSTTLHSMNRRKYLKLAGLGVGLLSGCAEGGSGSSPTSTLTVTPSPSPAPASSPTSEPTPTPTPEPQRPEIVETSLLYRWQSFGDVLDKQVNAVGKGAQAIIGFRHVSEVHDGTLDVTEQVRVFGPEGNRVGHKSFDDEQLVSGDGPEDWEHALNFDTSTWDRGEHDYEVLIRDNISGKLSEGVRGSFRVNKPLGADEISLSNVQAPDTVSVGQDYSFTLILENLSSRDGSLVSTYSAKYKSSSTWYTDSDSKMWATIPSGGKYTWKSGTTSFDNTGTVQFRVDEIDETWEVEVTSN